MKAAVLVLLACACVWHCAGADGTPKDVIQDPCGCTQGAQKGCEPPVKNNCPKRKPEDTPDRCGCTQNPPVGCESPVKNNCSKERREDTPNHCGCTKDAQKGGIPSVKDNCPKERPEDTPDRCGCTQNPPVGCEPPVKNSCPKERPFEEYLIPKSVYEKKYKCGRVFDREDTPNHCGCTKDAQKGGIPSVKDNCPKERPEDTPDRCGCTQNPPVGCEPPVKNSCPKERPCEEYLIPKSVYEKIYKCGRVFDREDTPNHCGCTKDAQKGGIPSVKDNCPKERPEDTPDRCGCTQNPPVGCEPPVKNSCPKERPCEEYPIPKSVYEKIYKCGRVFDREVTPDHCGPTKDAQKGCELPVKNSCPTERPEDVPDRCGCTKGTQKGCEPPVKNNYPKERQEDTKDHCGCPQYPPETCNPPVDNKCSK